MHLSMGSGTGGTTWVVQDSGWMTDDIGGRWFTAVFLKHCGPARSPLLLLDGHLSHESLVIIERAIEENIIFLSTTIGQNGVWTSQPLYNLYNEVCTSYLSKNPPNQASLQFSSNTVGRQDLHCYY